MMRSHLKPFIFITILLSFVCQDLLADEQQRFIYQDSEGFCTTLRDVSDITVTQHLKEIKVELETQLSQLSLQVKKKSFKAIDTLITIIMPGGLVYAKMRHDSYKRSEEALAEVREELQLISGELIAFQTETGELVVARVE